MIGCDRSSIVKEDDGQHNGARPKHELRPVIDMPLLQQALSTLSMDSCATDESNDRRDTQQEDDRDFSFPRREVKRQRQDERRRRKVIQGYARGGNTRLKPAPSRDLLIYRVDSDTTAADVRDFDRTGGMQSGRYNVCRTQILSISLLNLQYQHLI